MVWLAWCGVGWAQRADEPWRTVRTDHFVVHYPVAAEPWTLDAVGRLEELHARVVEEVGYEPDEQRLRIRVVDPYGLSNGSTLPFLHHARIELWATPPEPNSPIGNERSWAELLLVHEDAHLVHLTRPSRNPLRSLVDQVTGFGPIMTGAPRWVVEGYATVVEGRLTGFGRPNGDFRAVFLRGLALSGALPSYLELSGNGRFLGQSDAYLVGSAYLEWLEARAGEGSLRALWRRMTARQTRSFDAAFAGVFGEAPDVLYGRFCAELTADAVEARDADPVPAGVPFEEVLGSVAAISTSPDGARVVATGVPPGGGTWVRVWSTAPDEKAEEKQQERVEKILAEDPEDVAPVAPVHPPHEVLHSLVLQGRLVRDVVFLPSGDEVLLTMSTRDPSGRLRWDLFRWALDGSRLRRVTRFADVRAPAPTPDGASVVAVRQAWGRTELVRVDLATGEVVPLPVTEPGVQVDGPRVSPDGQRLAWLEVGHEGWTAVLGTEDGRERLVLPAPRPGGVVTQLAWRPDGSLVGIVGEEGGLDAVTLWRDGQPVGRREAALPGGILAMDAGVDQVFAVTLGPRGQDLLQVPLTAEGLPPRAPAPPPVGRPLRRGADTEPSAFEASSGASRAPEGTASDGGSEGGKPKGTHPVGEAPALPAPTEVHPRPYGVGPLEAFPLVAAGGTSAGDAGQLEVGVRLGDVIGRTEILMMGGLPAVTGGAGGGRLGVALRVLPVTTTGDLWVGGDDRLGTRRVGTALGVAGTWAGSVVSTRAQVGALVDRPLEGDHGPGRDLASGEVQLSARDPRTQAFGASLRARGTVGLLDADPAWTLSGGARGWLLRGSAHLELAYDRGRASTDGIGGFVLGGVPNTVIPNAAEAFRVVDPAFAPGTATGTDHDRVEVSIGSPVSLVGVRHRLGPEVLGSGGYTEVGLRFERLMPAQPFARLPSSLLGVGVACRVEGPGQGIAPHTCQELDDWAGWAWLTWDVGR